MNGRAIKMNRNRSLLTGITAFVLATALFGGLGFWWYESTRPEHRLRQGQQALQRGDIETAERLIDKLDAAGYPDHAHLLRGQVYLHLKRLNPAIEEYNLIRSENEPILAEASLIYGLGFLSLNLQARAEKLFLYVVQVQPDNVDARRGLAVIYFDRGAMNLALKHLSKWSQLDDTDGQPHRFMAIIYKDSMAEEVAIKEFQAALERRLPAATREEVLLDLAEVFVKRTQFAEALACLDQGPLETPKARALAPEVRAVALYNLNRGSEAAEVLEHLLRADPPSPRALRYRALIYINAGDPSAAEPLLEKALRVDPHEAECRYQLAMLYERLGRRKEAAEQRRLLDETQKLITILSDLNREAIQKPTDVGVRRRLAEVCEKLGKFDLAQSWRRAEASCRAENQSESGGGAPTR
jgi:tetratricopeptide (TPR) repeat protein